MNITRALNSVLPFSANRLLASLPDSDLARLAPHLQSVPLPLGWSLYESGSKMRHVYFPSTGIVSLISGLENGDAGEIALAGNEGVVGISLFMGGESTPSRAVVQVEGQAYRLPSDVLKREFERGGQLQLVLLRYTQALLTQMSQTAACNRHHAIKQQLCRKLLLVLDRTPTNELLLTQEVLANALGVRREGVVEAASDLQDSGVIHYRRGRITVLDRRKLEACACECYAVVRRETDRLSAPSRGDGKKRRGLALVPR